MLVVLTWNVSNKIIILYITGFIALLSNIGYDKKYCFNFLTSWTGNNFKQAERSLAIGGIF